jgi:DNA-directed RNA polymerase specialized sigma24 family protein
MSGSPNFPRPRESSTTFTTNRGSANGKSNDAWDCAGPVFDGSTSAAATLTRYDSDDRNPSMAPPTAAVASSAPAGQESWVPTPEIIGYARRLLLRQYHFHPQDLDDLIGQALLDLAVAAKRVCSNHDGLFLVIVRRRACDFWRRHRADLPLSEASRVTCTPEEYHLDEMLIQQRLLSVTLSRNRLDKRRLIRITRQIFAGSTFAEACREAGVPRGSQGRYRRTLRDLLTTEVVGRSGRPNFLGRRV